MAIETAKFRQGRSLEIEGVGHGSAPIPMGARVGPLLYSSGISGKDAATSTLPAGAEDQVRHAFLNMRSLLAAGGASVDDVVRVTVYLKDGAVREPLNKEWVAMFPDPHDRPARHALMYDLQAGMVVQLEVVAYVQSDVPADHR
jgi:2-iminobutanoate/2-iminopropanoate deaminase